MRRRILSIDFDYFLDTDIATRNMKFPDGVDEKQPLEMLTDWDRAYSLFPELHNIGLIDEYRICCNNLSWLRFGKVLVADSHKDIAKLFPLIREEDDLEVIHIDFHHDNYITGGDKVDCANWVRHLMISRPDNTALEWIRREDSEMVSLMGAFPYPNTRDFVIEGEFDYIFLCFSPEWTPPHLKPYFDEMCERVTHLEPLEI